MCLFGIFIMTVPYYVLSIVYFNKADISLYVVNNEVNLSTLCCKIYAVEIIKCIIVQYAKKKGKLDNPNIWFCPQMQCKNP